MTHQDTRLECVRDGHGRGWSYTPLNGKVPIEKGWQKAPKEKEAKAVAWAMKGNVGLRTGQSSGIVVVDVDLYKGADISGLDLPETVSVRTGGGGMHYYYRHDAPIGNDNNGKCGDHIDIKGDGGQVVAPGSVHPESKKPYVYVNTPEEFNVAKLPKWVVDAMKPKERKHHARQRATVSAPYLEKVINGVCEEIRAAVEARNPALNNGAFRLGQFVGEGKLERGSAETLLLDAASVHFGVDGFTRTKSIATIKSGLDAGGGVPSNAPDNDAQECRPAVTVTAKATTPFAGEKMGKIKASAVAGEMAKELYRDGVPIMAIYRDDVYVSTGGRYSRRADSDMEAWITKKMREWGIDEKATTGFVKNVILNLNSHFLIPSYVDPPMWRSKNAPAVGFIDMENGIFNLDAYLAGDPCPLNAKNPDLFTLNGLGYEYKPAAGWPLWQNFLDRVMPDKRVQGVLQEFAGLCLTREMTFQKFLLLVGEGSNGKGVFTETVRELIGPENVSAVGLELFPRPFSMANTYGKLLNICGDAPEMDKVAEGVLKAMVGGDVMEFERKYKPTFSARPTAKLIIACNEPPSFADRSRGLWRRLLYVPFDVIIPDKEQDKGLKRKLLAELPGIFNWAIKGLVNLTTRGHFDEPSACRAALEQLQEDSNPHKTWILENIVYDPIDKIQSGEAYKKYSDAIAAQGLRSLGAPNFGKELRRTLCLDSRQEIKKEKLRGTGSRLYFYTNLAWKDGRDETQGQQDS